MTRAIDRESAFEILQARAQSRTSGPPVAAGQPNAPDGGVLSKIGAGLEDLFKPQGKRMTDRPGALSARRRPRWRAPSGSAIAREILRGITGGMR